MYRIMKSILLSVLIAAVLGLGFAGCGSSPQSKQTAAAREAKEVWRAHEFAKESKALVKPGMTVQEVINAWGAPVSKSAGAKKYMKWTYKLENIMYYRGWDSKKGARDQGTMIVEFTDDKVTTVTEK